MALIQIKVTWDSKGSLWSPVKTLVCVIKFLAVNLRKKKGGGDLWHSRMVKEDKGHNKSFKSALGKRKTAQGN